MKQRVIDLLRQAQAEGEKFFDHLTLVEGNIVGTAEHWSARDMLAHVSEWDRHLVARCTDPRAQAAAAATYDGEINQVNASIFEAYRGKTLDEIRHIFVQSHHDAIRFIESLSDEELADTRRYEWMEGKPAWRSFLGTFYIHAFGHYEESYFKRGEAGDALALEETATSALLTVSDSDEWRALVTYNRACMDAISGKKEIAINRLGEALRLNPGLMEWSREDPDLVSLHGDPGYEALYHK